MRNIRLQYVSKNDKKMLFEIPHSMLKASGWKEGDLIKMSMDDDGVIQLKNVTFENSEEKCIDELEDDLYAIYGGD